MKLTLEALTARAAKHQTRSQLKHHDLSAYRSAQEQNLLDTLYPNPAKPPLKLTEQIIIERAKECSTRKAFKLKYDAAWRAACKLNLMDMLFPRKPKPAPKQPRLKKPELCGPPKPVRQYRKLDHAACRELAKRFSSLSHMQGEDMALYMAVRKFGLRDELFPVRQKSISTTNCFYMARTDGLWYNNLPVYKVGVTSEHLGSARVGSHARHARNTLIEVIKPTRTIGKATDVERYALTLGMNPGLQGFVGCTEYRAYSEEDVQAIKDMVELCAM